MPRHSTSAVSVSKLLRLNKYYTPQGHLSYRNNFLAFIEIDVYLLIVF